MTDIAKEIFAHIYHLFLRLYVHILNEIEVDDKILKL